MNENDFNTLWTNLVDRKYRAEGPLLSEPERNLYAVNCLRGSVPRSGFLGYFENSTASEIAGVHQGLRALCLPSVLALLEKAQNIVLRGSPLPEDHSPVEIFADSITEEEYERESKRIDEALAPIEEEFYKHNAEIWKALCEYADTHQLKPKS